MKRTTFVLTLFLLIGIETAAYSGTINVPADQPTIQAGIDAAVDGDIVIVADGVYMGNGNKNIDFGGKSITVKSKNGPQNCVIDGQGTGGGFNFHSNEGPNSILHGFTITNFNHSGIWIAQSDPTIDNCVITRNTVIDPNLPAGAGILIHGHPTWHASPLIKNCIIRYNFGAGSGGGIGTYECSPTIQNCDISFNQAGLGGGVSVYTGNPIFTNCTIIGNTSTNQGGGVYVDHYWGGTSSYFTNSVIWDNSPNNVAYGRGDATITYCNIQGGWAGEGNIDADPLFVDPLADLHLTALSPCINAGNNDAPSIPTNDRDGLPRIVDGTVDIGAYEFQGFPIPPDVSGCIKIKGAPAVNLEVKLIQKGGKNQTTFTDENGFYQFENLVPGKAFDIKITGPVFPIE